MNPPLPRMLVQLLQSILALCLPPLPALGWLGRSPGPLTVRQQSPEQPQPVDAGVPVPGEGVQAFQDALAQPGPPQLICGQSCRWAPALGPQRTPGGSPP